MIGQIIANYEIKSLLGEGGMANVYLAEHLTLRNKVAIKILKFKYASKLNIRNRFLSEARILAQLNHPNIIKVTDLIDAADVVAFVMEYIAGISLKELIEKKGNLRNEEISVIYLQMLKAVGFIHSKGIIHRDIKPENFMVKSNGNIKLLDFGIVKKTNGIKMDYTETGILDIMGTPLYMSPEQMENTKDVTPSTDIYSLGLVLWFMVKGRNPYNTANLSFIDLIKMKNERLPLTHSKWDKVIQISTQNQITKRVKSIKLLEELFNETSNKADNTINKNLKYAVLEEKIFSFFRVRSKHLNGFLKLKKKEDRFFYFFIVGIIIFISIWQLLSSIK